MKLTTMTNVSNPECDIYKSNDIMHVIQDVKVRKIWFPVDSTRV
jgi:hypothetical protein